MLAFNETDPCGNFHTNQDVNSYQSDPNHTYFNIGLVTGFLCVFIVGMCGNTVVIYLSFNPTLSKAVFTMNTYIFHLALADALYVFTSLFFTVTNFNRKGWIFGHFGCKLIPAIDIVTMHVSVYVLGVLSLERYLALVNPMVINRYRSWCYARVVCVVIWFSGLLLASPFTVMMELRDVAGTDGGESCMWSQGYESHRHYITGVFWVVFAIPSFGMILTYFLICIHFVKVGPKHNSSAVASTSKRGVVSIVILIVGVYWLCFTPFWIYQMLLLYDHCSTFDQNNVMGLITLILSYLNSCINPFLYTLLPRKYNVWRKSRRDRRRHDTASIPLRHFD